MKKNFSPRLLFWILPVLFLGTFFFYPLFEILKLSFSRLEGGLLEYAGEILRNQAVANVLKFTVWQAFLSTILTLAVGLPGAYLFGKYAFKGKKILRALTGVPFVMPTLVVAAGFYALLGPKGLVNQALGRTVYEEPVSTSASQVIFFSASWILAILTVATIPPMCDTSLPLLLCAGPPSASYHKEVAGPCNTFLSPERTHGELDLCRASVGIRW